MNTLTAFLPIVNPAFETIPSTGDDFRPTAGPDFTPSLEDEAAYLDLVATLEERDAIMGEWARVDRDEAMEAAFGSAWDLVSDAELIEAGGYHPANNWE